VDALFCPLDGSPLTASPAAVAAAAATDPYVGREILGHIEIRQLVGIGAMGRVYRAFQRGIDRDVAVKILHRELSANPTVVSRFNREAKVAARLAHPHVVHVLLVGQLPDGAMYIVMEYLDGMSLESALAAAGGAMPLHRALHIAVNLCDAAGAAHAQGIVHRDLKPENVMLIHRADDPDFVKVLDFGIARLDWGKESIATAAGLIFGTARYISPEAAQGEQVGPQGDVYSIATMVYQMLAGRTPFEAVQVVAVLVQQIHDAPPPLASIPRAAYVPSPIAAAVMKNLSKKASERAQDARMLGKELVDAALMSGLSAQDVLARPSLRAGAALASGTEALAATKTAFGAPLALGVETLTLGEGRVAGRTEIAEPQETRGASTARWAPPGAPDVEIAAAPVSRTPAPASKVPSSVEATMADAPPPAGRDRWRAKTSLLMAACFSCGALGMAAVAWRGGMLGKGASRVAPPSASNVATPEAVAAQVVETPTVASRGAAQPVDSPLPPLVIGRASSAAPAASPAARALIDVPSGKPGLGQPVDLVARVSSATPGGHAKVEDARFRIAGPGIPAGTELGAADDGAGVFRTTFTFLQSGRFDVTFSARADGSAVRAARSLVVDSTPAVPPASSAGAVRVAAPPASAKWL
jgi:tRNA A-37 threonylcarbamoyl transferase component Bud32